MSGMISPVAYALYAERTVNGEREVGLKVELREHAGDMERAAHAMCFDHFPTALGWRGHRGAWMPEPYAVTLTNVIPVADVPPAESGCGA